MYKHNSQETELTLVHAPSFRGDWCRVRSGVVPPPPLGPAGHQQTSAKITAAWCLSSSVAVWFLASSLTASRANPWGGGGRQLWQDQQLRRTQTQTPSLQQAGPASGRQVLTMAQRCPVLSVLVVRTLCYILVLYKWWSMCRTSAPPRDHLMSWVMTVGPDIPEVVRKSFYPSNFTGDVWNRGWCCKKSHFTAV